MTALSEEYINDLKETFTTFDNDGDGLIKTKDLSIFNYFRLGSVFK